MAARDHSNGFEKEAKFSEILWEAVGECRSLKARTVKKIIAHVNPDFMDGLFRTRPCVRKLRYTGSCCQPMCASGENDFFKRGEVYESIDFTGATYTIVGYKEGKGRIGCSYFEWLDDEDGR